ncbi:MAG: hypothetical protein SOZ11_05545 [Bacilli bacterium]|nr:hypothetical protein [Bacilli bacterium]
MKLVFRTLDYYKIPWYMLDEGMYLIDSVEFDGFDPVLDGTVEYRVYLL